MSLITIFSIPAFATQFKEKSISNSSQNKTGSVTVKSVSGRKSDNDFTRAMADTSVRLLQEVCAEESRGSNVLISPDSILTVLSLVESGASGNTLSEMETALGGISAKRYSQYLYTMHKRLTRSKEMTYRVANSLWYRKNSIKIKRAFLTKVASYYQADVYAAPFNHATVKDINRWVYNKTNGKIRSIIRQLSRSARLVLVNAIYFKGKWVEPYHATTKRSFTKATGAKQNVEMLEGVESTYLTVNGADGFIKPYQSGKTAFLALLPPAGTSVDEYVAKLTGSALIEGYKNRIKTHVTVRTRLPKFTYDFDVSLEKPLQKLGIHTAFSGRARFSGMTSSPVAIDQVLHKTHIAVDKDGTEAAAATAVVVKATSVYDPEMVVKEVYLQRPFVYAIIDVKTGIPLFLGVVKSI